MSRRLRSTRKLRSSISLSVSVSRSVTGLPTPGCTFAPPTVVGAAKADQVAAPECGSGPGARPASPLQCPTSGDFIHSGDHAQAVHVHRRHQVVAPSTGPRSRTRALPRSMQSL